MAKKTPDGKIKYWYEGIPCTLIKGRTRILNGTQDYWYNGQPQEIIPGIKFIAKPRCFAILLGF